MNRRRFLTGGLAAAASGATTARLPARPGAVWSASAAAPPRIVYAEGAAEPVRFAAAELRRYLEQILGVPVRADAAGSRIELREIDDEDLGDEGFEIACDGAQLTISGQPSGVAYGSFEFLRRFAGCQFSGLGPDYEYTPRLERIDVDVPRLRKKPQLWYRGYQFFYAEPLDLIIYRLDWMVKNGLNYVIFTPRHDDIVPAGTPVDPLTGQPSDGPAVSFVEGWWKSKVEPEVLRRGLRLDFNHHNLFYWVPPHRHFEEHPEWYPLVDGKRTAAPRQLAICTSNNDAVATLVANVKIYLRENPRVKVVGVIVEDGSGMCQCEQCLSGDVNRTDAFRTDFDYKYPDAENRSKSLRYARLVNHVAREIRDEFPGALVGHATYIDIQWPPRGMKLEPNVVSWVAIYWRDAAHPLAADSASPVNRFFFDILRQWKETQPSHVIAYEYYMGMEAQKSLPYPMSEVVCRDWPNLKRLGIEGATIQSWSANHNAYALNNLAFARNGWEDTVDHDALLDDFLRGMFGAAAEAIKPVHVEMIAALKRVETDGPAVSPWLDRYDVNTTTGGSFLPDGYTVVYVLEQVGRKTLDRALQRAKQRASNERERRAVADWTAAATYWRMAARALELDLRAKKAEKDGENSRAASLLREAAVECERVHQYVSSLPSRGWVSVMTPPQWPRLAAAFRARADKQNPPAG